MVEGGDHDGGRVLMSGFGELGGVGDCRVGEWVELRDGRRVGGGVYVEVVLEGGDEGGPVGAGGIGGGGVG